MVQIHSSPTVVKIVPRDGELEIKLDITINLTTEGLTVTATQKKDNIEKEEVGLMVPDFISGTKVNFGKTVTEK